MPPLPTPSTSTPTCAVSGCIQRVARAGQRCSDHRNHTDCGECGNWYDTSYQTHCGCSGIECPNCGAHVPDDEDVQVGSQQWCQACADRHAEWCEPCDQYHPNHTPCPHSTQAVERYDFNPTTLSFHHAPEERRDPAQTEYVGVELEVAFNSLSKSAALRKLRELLEGDTDVYLKHDGSIANGRCGEGVELVTHPGTWAFWAQPEVRQLWEWRLAEMKAAGFRSFDAQSCGLHVHVSRTLLTGTTLVRLQALLYDNPTLFKRISQRRNFEYCTFDARDANDARFRVCKAGTAKYSMRFRDFRYDPHANADRRVALNLPNDTPTVEYRFFRGTLHAPSFWKSLECVHATLEYARTQPADQMSELPFLTWLFARERTYPRLTAYLLRWYAPMRALADAQPRGLRTPLHEFCDVPALRPTEPLIGV